MLAPDLIITTTDLARLQPVLDTHDTPAAHALDLELRRARVVAPDAVPADVVTMDSEVAYQDVATGVTRTIRIVYPHAADAGRGAISVLAPIGTALLGLRTGQEIAWDLPTGRKQLRVTAVTPR